MHDVLRIARKEFEGFFETPTAFIFLGAFLGVTLFTFFWVDTFFARNIADVRPLFEWMPMLLIFLVAAITMRMWSEERRAGTLEFLLTAPVDPMQLVLGKFVACVGLVGVALLLTAAIPLSVSQLGNLDWGPVIGGYLATLFLASAYIAIGLFVSARSDNAIVSLIVTAAMCGGFYLIGSDSLTSLFGNSASELLKLLGSGSRFESITRGVLDLRDVYFYLSLVGVFLTLNVLVLEWLRWAGNKSNARHRRYALLASLIAANFLAANLWLAPVAWARIDMTQGSIYSISDATRGYLSRLREPLLIRGYFSSQTHPLLAPLVPRIRDLLDEYARAGNGNVRVEFIDPLANPELEREAGEKFGIRPVAFRTADKYQTAVVNSYFDIVIQYGDEFETLGFADLIDVKASSETELDVDLRNPEYDLTRAIRKVLFAYQGGGNLFARVDSPIRLMAYLSPADQLPGSLSELRGELEELLGELQTESSGKLELSYADPESDGGALGDRLAEEYGLRPLITSPFDPQPFWFSFMLEAAGKTEPVPFPEDATRGGFERAIKAALKRVTPGSLRTVALYTPSSELPPQAAAMGQQGGSLRYALLGQLLREEHAVTETTLEDGRVPAEADLLVLAGPSDLDDSQLFAIDQFLMQGGTVIVSTAPFGIDFRNGLSARPEPSGLEDWLKHHGITQEQKLVLDPQMGAFPVPVQRRLGGLVIEETQLVDYPYFVDLRRSGLDDESGILGGIEQITMHWAAPLTVAPLQSDVEAEAEAPARKVTPLLQSSADAWTSEDLNLLPNPDVYGPVGFPVGEAGGPYLLGVVVEGRFDSFFAGKESPLLARAQDTEAQDTEDEAAEADASEAAAAEPDPMATRVIDKSPEAARIIVLGSKHFLSDQMLGLTASTLGTDYVNPVQLVENAVDWSLEDRGLVSIRGRAQFSRTLTPLPRERQVIWEYVNYVAAALALGLLWFIRLRLRIDRRERYQQLLSEVGV